MSLAATARRLITRRGEALTFEERIASGNTTHAATGMLVNVDQRLVDGVTIHKEDRVAWVAPSSITPAGTPQEGTWFLVDGSAYFRVVSARPHRVSGEVAVWELLVRG